MNKKPMEIDLKLQVIDELADVLHTFNETGSAAAQRALKQVLDAYPQIHGYARVMRAFSAVESFINNPVGKDIDEVFEVMGRADIAIAAEEV